MISRKALKIRRRKGLQAMRRWGHKEYQPGDLGRAGTTPTPCSCFMCGNPRRKFKGKECLTIQERKASLPDE